MKSSNATELIKEQGVVAVNPNLTKTFCKRRSDKAKYTGAIKTHAKLKIRKGP